MKKRGKSHPKKMTPAKLKPMKLKSRLRSLPKPIPFNKDPKVSVVIPVMNERKTIAAVIRQAGLVHPSTEVIVVANGSTDGSDRIARKMGARVICYKEPLGHDVGRSIGAMHAKGSIILFLDGDIVIGANDLKPFISAVEDGVDVALNNYSGKTDTEHVHSVVLSKYALNLSLVRPDLEGSSMTTIPHAISRKALDLIESENLAVPPLAQTIAVEKGLEVKRVHFVNVGRTNPRKRKQFKVDPLLYIIIGDHLEAISWLLKETNERGNLTDLTRDRSLVG